MLNSETESRSAFVAAGPSGSVADGQAAGSTWRGRRPLQGHIGFIGLGHMGTAIAANLAAAGRQVIAYVRRAEQMGKLAALGLKPTTDITEVYDREFVISMLPDDASVREVVFGRPDLGADGLAKCLIPGAIHLSMSTISTSASSDLASEHARYGQGYVAAPVFGNPDAAKARQLFVIAAGEPNDVERCRPIFDALGQQTFVVSSAPATANLVKLAGNAMSATTLEVLGEVLALARKCGLDPPGIPRDSNRNHVRQPRPPNLRRQDCWAAIRRGRFHLPVGSQGYPTGAQRGRVGGRADAFRQRGARSTHHRHRTRLFRA